MADLAVYFFQIFSKFPENFAMALLFNIPIVALTYFVFWKLFANKLRNWRIQIERRADSKQLIREIKNSFFVLIVGASLACIVTYLGSQGYTNIYLEFSANPFWLALTSFPILIIIDDTWFYWVHRALHHKSIYKYIHHEHHKSLDVTPLTSLSFHWAEPLLLTLWIVPASLVLPIWAPALALMQVYGFLDNLKSHLGYEIYPKGFNRSPLRFLTTSTYHNLHHTKFRGNYGVHFRIWDRLMGTELDTYEQKFDDIQARKQQSD